MVVLADFVGFGDGLRYQKRNSIPHSHIQMLEVVGSFVSKCGIYDLVVKFLSVQRCVYRATVWLVSYGLPH
jgi:hypothetical protein